MEAVLPLKVGGDYQEFDLDRARMLLFSIEQRWLGEHPIKLHIITQRATVGLVREALGSSRIQINVMAEGDLLPLLDEDHRRNGFKQQLIKICAHRIVSEPYFLTLDADLVCCKPFDEASFLVDGKGVSDWEPRLHLWWPNSANWLQTPPNLDAPGMSVTPEYLSREVCVRLEEHLLALHGDDVFARLLNVDQMWSEYSLYNLFAEKQGIVGEFHHDAEWSAVHDVPLRCKYNIWVSADSHDLTRNFEPDARGTFMVCQSNTHIPPQDIWARIQQFYAGAPF